MKRRFLQATLALTAALLLGHLPIQARTDGIDSLNFEVRASVRATLGSDVHDATFAGEHLNLNVWGSIGDKLHYRLRQRFTKPLYSETNPLNATDLLLLNYRFADHWSLDAGKTALYIGGMEFDHAPIDLFYWDKFASGVWQVYALGVNLNYHSGPQMISAQFVQSPFSLGKVNCFMGSLYWNGRMLPGWDTIWSLNLADHIDHHKMGYISLGNRFHLGDFRLDLDLMERYHPDQQGFLSDVSLVFQLLYRLPKLELFSKGGYDYNDARNGDYDRAVPAGTHAAFIGGGLFFYPVGGARNTRLHLFGYYENVTRNLNLSLGITYRMRLIKK